MIILPRPRFTLFPYTTLFRSAVGIVLAAILFGALHAGGSVMQADAGISGNLVFILQALILFSIAANFVGRSEEHTSELQSLRHLVCRLLLEKKKLIA